MSTFWLIVNNAAMDMGVWVCRPHLNSVIQFICRVSSKVVFLSKSHHFADRLNSLAASSSLLSTPNTHLSLSIYLLLQESASLFPARRGSWSRTRFPTAHTHSQPPRVLSAQGRPQPWGHSPPIRASAPCPIWDPLNTFTPHFPGHRPFLCSHPLLLEVASFSQVSTPRI